ARLFSDARYRKAAVARLGNPDIVAFWSDFESMAEASKRELARPILYRIRQLYRAAAVRNITCRTDCIDWGELLARGAIVLISLAGESIRAERDTLAEVILGSLHATLMS